MVPSLMEQESKKRGGCVISHSPGAGKTFLVTLFLVSYLKLFSGKRPLVLAPKTTLYTGTKKLLSGRFMFQFIKSMVVKLIDMKSTNTKWKLLLGSQNQAKMLCMLLIA